MAITGKRYDKDFKHGAVKISVSILSGTARQEPSLLTHINSYSLQVSENFNY